jgi:LacI family transcriptional regulator
MPASPTARSSSGSARSAPPPVSAQVIPGRRPRTPRTPAGPRRITIRDIAREAGVTPATVSYVLSGTSKAKISTETRERVRRAAEHLGYAPDLHARSLVTGRTMTLGVCFGATGEAPFTDDYDRQVLHGLVRGTALAGYALQVLAQPLGGLPFSVDGWIAVQSPPSFEVAAFGRKPVVFLDPTQPIPQATCLWARNAEAGELLAEAVHVQRRAVVFVLHEKRERSPYAYLERLRGFGERALALGGMRMLVSEADPTSDTAVRAWAKTWAPRIRAGEIRHVAAVSDMLAVRLCRALSENGLQAPADYSLTGCDNTLHAQLAHPAISTVEVGASELALAAVAQLVAKLGGPQLLEDHASPAPRWRPRESHQAP